MEDAKRWPLVIGVPVLCLALGFGWGLVAHRVIAPAGRFVATDAQGTTALDTKTGQYCMTLPNATTGLKGEYPTCLDLYRNY